MGAVTLTLGVGQQILDIPKAQRKSEYSQTAYWTTSAGKGGDDIRDCTSAIHSRSCAES